MIDHDRDREWKIYLLGRIEAERPDLVGMTLVDATATMDGHVIVELVDGSEERRRPYTTTKIKALGPYEWGVEMLVARTLGQVTDLVAMAMGNGATAADARAAIGRWLIRLVQR